MEDAIIALTATKARVLLLLRQAVLTQNRVITRQHLAASEGSVMAEKVFSQGTAIEGLDEEAAKAYKEAKKAQQAQAAQSRGGGAYRGGYRGRYNYHPYQQYQVPQMQAYSNQYAPAPGMAMMPAQGQQLQGFVQQHGQDGYIVQQQPCYFLNQRGGMQLQQLGELRCAMGVARWAITTRIMCACPEPERPTCSSRLAVRGSP